jgi:hypothetical protein
VRRSKLFRPSDATLQVTVQQAAAWLGVYADVQESIADEFERMQWQPMENGLTFLQRLQLRENFRFRSRDVGNTPTIQIIAVSGSSQITYYHLPDETYHHIHDYEYDSNLLSEVSNIAHGLFDATSPGDGEEFIFTISESVITPLDHRLVRYYLSRQLGEPDLELIAQSSNDHLATRKAALTIETHANLSLEPYDRVTALGTQYYVLRILERWQRGRLTQRISLTAV